jgi:ATP synthase protein I
LNRNSQEVSIATQQVLTWQVGMIAAISVSFFIIKGQDEGISTLYGGLVGVFTALLLSRSIVRAEGAISQGASKKKSLMILYLGALQRFVIILALSGVGLSGLGLSFVPMIFGFTGAQLGYLACIKGAPDKRNARWAYLKKER